MQWVLGKADSALPPKPEAVLHHGAARMAERTCSAHVLVAGEVREPQRDLVAGAGRGAAVDAELQDGAHLGAHEAQLWVAPLLRSHHDAYSGIERCHCVRSCGDVWLSVARSDEGRAQAAAQRPAQGLPHSSGCRMWGLRNATWMSGRHAPRKARVLPVPSMHGPCSMSDECGKHTVAPSGHERLAHLGLVDPLEAVRLGDDVAELLAHEAVLHVREHLQRRFSFSSTNIFLSIYQTGDSLVYWRMSGMTVDEG